MDFYNLITIIAILVSIIFLIIFIRIDFLRSKSRYFLYICIFHVTLLLGFELLISYQITGLLYFIAPFHYPLWYLIYPLFYLYNKRLVTAIDDYSSYKWQLHFILPLIVLIFGLAVYLISSNDNKFEFIYGDLTQLSKGVGIHSIFSSFLIVAYYMQFIFYMFLFIRLVKESNKKYGSKNTLSRNIYLFISGVFLYELSFLLLEYFYGYYNSLLTGQVFSFLFIIFAGFIGLNHSLYLLRLQLYSLKRNEDSNTNYYHNLDNHEKIEIKDSIEKYIIELKLYTNPNLRIDLLAKKLHISSKKMSIVINETTGKNFIHYINDFRIEEAIRIIHSYNGNAESIEKLCEKVGFNSRATFYRAFKSFTGKTPKEYILSQHSSKKSK